LEQFVWQAFSSEILNHVLMKMDLFYLFFILIFFFEEKKYIRK